MARKYTGNTLLNLTLQPGSEFTTTEMGFDNGSRTVVCDESVAAKLEPQVGQSDTEIKYYTPYGLKPGVHQWMFLTDVAVTNQNLGLVQMRLSFKGIKRQGGDTFSTSANAGNTAGGGYFILDWKGRPLQIGTAGGRVAKRPFFQPGTEQIQFEAEGNQVTINLQTIDVTYLAPSLSVLEPLNSLVDAPLLSSKPSALYNLETGRRLATPRFQGWQLTSRDMQVVGTKRQIYQITDTITERILF